MKKILTDIDILELPGKWRDGTVRQRLWELVKEQNGTEQEIEAAKELERHILNGNNEKLVRFVFFYKSLYKGEKEVSANTLSFEF